VPYRPVECDDCGRSFSPQNIADSQRGTCRGCAWKVRSGAQMAQMTDLHLRDCGLCGNEFKAKGDARTCGACTQLPRVARGKDDQPLARLSNPIRTAVFDLETFSLDRGWGVLLLGVVVVHGAGPEPVWHEFALTDSKNWPNKRSDDSEVAAGLINVLHDCTIAYAHNGKWFDIPWLNTIALKYGLPALNIKLVDPVQVARRKYRIGNNSLSAVADFLGLEESKMQLSPDVWRFALMDNDPEAWATLRERCRSDVRLLNEVAAKIMRDVGIIDYGGSAYR
jgi:hypothetical protein